ncbi:peptidylprolyl isomerase [Nocardioides sp. YIM 152588]|uniref:peptidylprolyl isomerase n=1 Tax=Nocardioides sp. YIM 152588 TaxID=3158259 RepID=UPI0032E3EDA9
MLKRALAGAPALLLLATLSACGGDEDTTASDATTSESPTTDATTDDASTDCTYTEDGSDPGVTLPPAEPTVSGEIAGTIETSIGDLPITLDADGAPCTVGSFVALAEAGYFDDTPCHRLTVATGFEVLQCGDPTGTGRGGPGYSIPDEYDGSETYGKGTLAMANTGQPDSGGSQFFIVYGDTALPPLYTVFGTVDDEGTEAIADAADAGVDPVNDPEDGTPKTAIDITGVVID